MLHRQIYIFVVIIFWFYLFRLQKYNIFLKYTKYYDDFWKILGLYASFHQFLSVFYRLDYGEARAKLGQNYGKVPMKSL
jgi:hypothetical protein